MVLNAFCRRIRLSISSWVSKSWATLTPCRLKAVAYIRMSSGWPAAAQACLPGRSSGRWSRPSIWTPAAIAALLTITQEFPPLPESNLGSKPPKLGSIERPPAGARENPVPNLITIRAM